MRKISSRGSLFVKSATLASILEVISNAKTLKNLDEIDTDENILKLFKALSREEQVEAKAKWAQKFSEFNSDTADVYIRDFFDHEPKVMLETIESLTNEEWNFLKKNWVESGRELDELATYISDVRKDVERLTSTTPPAVVSEVVGGAVRNPEELLELLLKQITEADSAINLKKLKESEFAKGVSLILTPEGKARAETAFAKRLLDFEVPTPSAVIRGGDDAPAGPVLPPATGPAVRVSDGIDDVSTPEVPPEVARSGIKQKIAEIFGKAKGYSDSLSPTARSRALKGILVGAGLIGASGLTYAAWSNLSAGDGADALTRQTIRIKEIIDPIWEHDVSPWTLTGGSLKNNITEADKTRFTRNITDAVFSNNVDQLTPHAMAKGIVNLPSAKGDGTFGDNITYDSIMESDADWTMMGDSGQTKSDIINASEQLISIANEIESNAAAVEAAEAAEDSAPKASATEPGTSPTTTPPISTRPETSPTTTPPISTRPDSTPSTGGSAPSATSDSGYESSSLIMKEKGYLKSVQSSWTQDFDTAFRSFVDAGTAKGAVPTDMVGGQSWSDVAGSLGFPPNKSGAFSAIRYLEDFVGKGTSTPTTGVTTPAPSEAPASTAPFAAGDNPVLAAIIGAMYNQKLVGTPGFDLIREPKRIRALIESAPVGGPNPTGYGNAARIVMKMNPAIGGMLPAQLNGPVDEVFAKNPANKTLLQTIQVSINGIYESAIPTLVKPGLERSRELISRYLGSSAGGNWTVKPASNSVDQWVKLANERKMKLRLQIAAEMTPAEMAAARRIKMREI